MNQALQILEKRKVLIDDPASINILIEKEKALLTEKESLQGVEGLGK